MSLIRKLFLFKLFFCSGASKVLNQIAQREEERALDQERKDQEAMQRLKYLEKLQREDLEVCSPPDIYIPVIPVSERWS